MDTLLQGFDALSSRVTISLLTLLLLSVGFLGYHFMGLYLMRLSAGAHAPECQTRFRAHVLRRLVGLALLGLLPLGVFRYIFQLPFTQYGINLSHINHTAIWILGLLPVIVGINYYIAGKPANLRQYPQVRLTRWRFKELLINFFSWTLYLLGYEMLFRGFLLFALLHAFGLPLAVGINVAVYALVHLPKGWRETLGAIPFGLLLCLISLTTGSFLAAFVLHAMMALSNEFFAIKAHPDMQIKSNRL